MCTAEGGFNPCRRLEAPFEHCRQGRYRADGEQGQNFLNKDVRTGANGRQTYDQSNAKRVHD